ncbi:MAG: DUF6356 family protein [Legionellaceae bacterium]|nr:DUF6356 family protein [Legionellaceae bacterium]
MKSLFTEHPSSSGETYLQHFRIAFKIGFILIFSGIACVIHSFLPFIFKSTASKSINNLYKLILKRGFKD